MRKAGPITSAGWSRLPPGATRARTPGTAAMAGSDCFPLSALPHLALASLSSFGCGAWPTTLRSPLPTSAPGGALMFGQFAKEWPQSAGFRPRIRSGKNVPNGETGEGELTRRKTSFSLGTLDAKLGPVSGAWSSGTRRAHVGRRTRRRDRPGRFRPGVRLSVERGELRPVLRDEHGKQPCRLGRARVLAHRMGGPRRLEPALAGLPRSNRPQEPRGRVLLGSRHINLRRMQ
jgi:hypothetical protein